MTHQAAVSDQVAVHVIRQWCHVLRPQQHVVRRTIEESTLIVHCTGVPS